MADTTKTTSADALGLDAQAEMLKTERRANNVWNKLKRNKTAMIGLVIVVVMVFIAVFAPVLAPYDPNEIHPLDAFLKPFSEGHIFGTDQFGRDLLSRVIYGARVSPTPTTTNRANPIVSNMKNVFSSFTKYCLKIMTKIRAMAVTVR